MASWSEYLSWRGDITFDEVALNVVDSLLLSQLSYLDFCGIIGKKDRKKECTLAYAAKRYWEIHTEEEFKDCLALGVRTTGVLLKEMAKTKRFGELILRNYANRNDTEEEEQFAALEIVLSERESYISFVGTDDTLIGWKESFNMCYLSPIPAQTDAKEYLEQVLSQGGRQVYVGGHSKGGNLAVYSAVKCKDIYRKNIVRVYNFDGPGFRKEFIESRIYQEMKERIESWVPELSIVGMLLEHEENYRVVKSTQSGFLQHDPTSWEVMGAGLIELPSVKKQSLRMASGVKEWMSGLSPEELEEFVKRIFEVFAATNAKTLADINKDRFNSIRTMIHSFGSMDKKTKDMLYDLIKVMVSANIKKEPSKKSKAKGETKQAEKEKTSSVGRKKVPGNSH